MKDRRFCPRKWILMWGSDEYDAKRFGTKRENSSTLHRHFLNPSDGKYVRAHIPELRNNTINACLEGLLLITGPSRGRVTTRLLNPFTGSMLEYPSLNRLYRARARSETQPPSITFANSSSFAILVVASEFVAYAEPGFKQWRFISVELDLHHPCVFFQGRSHCLSATWGLFSIELEENQNELDESRERVFFTGPPCPLLIRGVESYYLVESDGQLLAVLGWRGSTRDDAILFRIFQVVNWRIKEDHSGSGIEMITLVPVRSIGKRALFIHPWHGGVSISTDVFPCFLPNSIYFYEGGLSPPKIYRLRYYQQPSFPNYCYLPIQDEEFLVSRRFSPFPVTEPRRKGRGIRRDMAGCC